MSSTIPALAKKAEKISAPLVAGAPAIWNVYYNHITLPDNGRGNHSVMVMGTIVGIHIDEVIIADGRVDVSRYTPCPSWL